jgi:hypothetical protein
MNWKLILLPPVLMGGLGAIYLLPTAGSVANSAIRMELPDMEGGWHFRKIGPSDEEIGALAKDTEFSKAICLKPRPGEITLSGQLIPDRLDLSIVLSGTDLNNSIHRPERCMPAQGHTILSGTDVPIKLDNGRTFTVRRLLSTQMIPSADRKSSRQMNCVTYYFFVGHDRIAHDHLQRTIMDIKDRLVRGMDQRWAYASTSMWYGKMDWMAGMEVTEKEADEKLVTFLSEFAEEQIDWDQVLP